MSEQLQLKIIRLARLRMKLTAKKPAKDEILARPKLKRIRVRRRLR